MKDIKKIDGSMGEGGGQVLRTALSLSAITGTEIELRKIRAGRAKLGLKRQHLTCVKAVIPVLLKAYEPSTVTITGGTHVPFAPIWEFFAETYLPELRRMGAKIEAELVQPGFYPAAGGVVKGDNYEVGEV